MNILIVSQYYWPENFRINDLAEELVSRGHKVYVTTSLPNYPQGNLYKGYNWKITREEHNGVKILRVPVVTRGKGGNFRLFMNYLSFAIISSAVTLVNFRKNIDVIFVYGVSPVTSAIPAIVLKLLTKKPILFWVLDLWPDSAFVNNRLKSRLLRNIITNLTVFINRSCDRLLIQSKSFYEPIIESGVDKNNIYYVPSWAESIFSSRKGNNLCLEDVTKLEPGFYITFAGNIGSGQDVECIIEAAKELMDINKNIHWMFIGEGSKYEWLKETVKKHGMQNIVHLIGYQPLNSMPCYYAFSSVLIASLKDEYIYSLTIPGKIQSYLASGRPIISMINGEALRVIEESNAGIAIESGDVEGLINAVIKMYEMSEYDRDDMGLNGEKYYKETFDRSVIISKIEKIMIETIEVE